MWHTAPRWPQPHDLPLPLRDFGAGDAVLFSPLGGVPDRPSEPRAVAERCRGAGDDDEETASAIWGGMLGENRSTAYGKGKDMSNRGWGAAQCSLACLAYADGGISIDFRRSRLDSVVSGVACLPLLACCSSLTCAWGVVW